MVANAKQIGVTYIHIKWNDSTSAPVNTLSPNVTNNIIIAHKTPLILADNFAPKVLKYLLLPAIQPIKITGMY